MLRLRPAAAYDPPADQGDATDDWYAIPVVQSWDANWRSRPILLKNSNVPRSWATCENVDLLERSRIDDRHSGDGQKTPKNIAAHDVGEFFNRIGGGSRMAKPWIAAIRGAIAPNKTLIE